MWERWRAEMDLALRDAELARDLWSDREFRVELRSEPGRALERVRPVSEAPLLSEDEVSDRLGWWDRALRWVLPPQAAASGRGGRSI
jgi:hypothetical protein